MAAVQMKQEWFNDVCRYFFDLPQDENDVIGLRCNIVRGLEEKLQAIELQKCHRLIREAKTEEERQVAVDRYCELKGIPEDFRY